MKQIYGEYMEVNFAYGETGLKINFPDDLKIDVVYAKEEQPLSDPKKKLHEAFEKPLMTPPLKEILKKNPEGKICIVISDSTRPVPSGIIIEALAETFDSVGVEDERVQILIATGLHRKTTPKELQRILGKEIVRRYDIINHVSEDPEQLKYLGESSFGTPIYINKHYLEATIKILTGYVEPHFFAGYSGGRKSIVPGIAGADTIKANHSVDKISSPYARFGILHKNPIYEDAQEIAKKEEIKPDFVINVCINSEHKITKVSAGSLAVHNELVAYQEKQCFFPIQERYDVVISGNGGYPLDLNLYQAVKSMAIGELAVKKGGTIISVNECRDGIGQEKFKELINMDLTPAEILNQLEEGKIRCKDQWEIQVLARVLTHAEVFVVSSLPETELGTIGLKYASSVEEALEKAIKKHGKNARILVLPNGPLILPRVKQ